MTVTVRGVEFTTQGGNFTGTKTVNLPTFTEVGDWAYVVGHARVDFTVTEAGFQRVAILDGYTLGANDWGYGEAWVGQVQDLDALECYVDTDADGALDSSTIIVLTSPNKPNTARTATVVTSDSNSFTLPGVSGRGAGAVALGVARHAIGSISWDGAASIVQRATYGAYYTASYGVSNQETVSAEASGYSGSASASAFVVIGVGGFGEAPPARLFPRSDGLGVGGGRHFPPPKSQQRSGRRFGYY